MEVQATWDRCTRRPTATPAPAPLAAPPELGSLGGRPWPLPGAPPIQSSCYCSPLSHWSFSSRAPPSALLPSSPPLCCSQPAPPAEAPPILPQRLLRLGSSPTPRGVARGPSSHLPRPSAVLSPPRPRPPPPHVLRPLTPEGAVREVALSYDRPVVASPVPSLRSPRSCPAGRQAQVAMTPPRPTLAER